MARIGRDHALQVAELDDLQSMEEISAEWWRLWERCPSATPFQSPAWLVPWWATFASGKRLLLLAVREAGQLIGLAPFYVENHSSQIYFLGRYLSDYLDFLIDPDHIGDVADSLRAYLQDMHKYGLISRVNLDELGSSSVAFGVPAPEGWTRAEIRTTLCPFLELTPGSDKLPQTIPQGIIRQIRESRRRAARHGNVSIVAIEHDYADFLSTLFHLHERRWRTRGMPGVLFDKSVQNFHRASAPGLGAAGLIRSHYLLIEGKRVGVNYTLTNHQRAYGYVMGFDPDYASVGPMNILLGHLIVELQMLGYCELDFGRGNKSWKYKWGCRDRVNVDISWMPDAV